MLSLSLLLLLLFVVIVVVVFVVAVCCCSGNLCPASSFQCSSSPTCIALEHKCDGVTDCPDSSDEFVCCKFISNLISVKKKKKYDHA